MFYKGGSRNIIVNYIDNNILELFRILDIFYVFVFFRFLDILWKFWEM